MEMVWADLWVLGVSNSIDKHTDQYVPIYGYLFIYVIKFTVLSSSLER